jgi:hypothetical protein
VTLWFLKKQRERNSVYFVVTLFGGMILLYFKRSASSSLVSIDLGVEVRRSATIL